MKTKPKPRRLADCDCEADVEVCLGCNMIRAGCDCGSCTEGDHFLESDSI